MERLSLAYLLPADHVSTYTSPTEINQNNKKGELHAQRDTNAAIGSKHIFRGIHSNDTKDCAERRRRKQMKGSG